MTAMKKLLSLIFALSLFLHTGLTLAQGITFNEGDINVQVSGETISGTVNAGKINALSGKKVTVGIKIFPSDATKEMVENGAAPIQTYENIVPGDAGGTANAPFSTTFSASDLDPKKNYPFAVTISIDGAVSVTKLGEINTGDGVVATQRKIDLDLGKKSYRLLAPIPGMSMLLDPDLCIEKKEQDPTTICDINDFINFVLKLLIGLAAVVLVVRLIIEGYVYMTTDVLFLKAGAKKTFFDALLGLVVALASYLILNTINPKLVENSLDVPTSTFEIDQFEGDSESYQKALTYTGGSTGMAGYDISSARFPSGISCPKTGGKGAIQSVANSFVGKITYNQTRRGTPGPNNSFYLDCSSFVTTVLLCSGITPSYNYAQTTTMFKGKERIVGENISTQGSAGFVNGKELKVGDLLGWTAEDKVSCKKGGACSGHVLMYVGNGMVMDSHSGEGKNPGESVDRPFSLEKYKSKYRWVYRL